MSQPPSPTDAASLSRQTFLFLRVIEDLFADFAAGKG